MNQPDEIDALRREQERLHAELQELDARISALEATAAPLAAAEAAPEPAAPLPPPSLPEPPPLPTRILSVEPLPAAPIPSAPEPEPTPAPAAAPAARPDSLELEFGRVWLVRLGIVILLTGLVFLGNYAYHEFIDRLGAGGKLALLYAAAAALALTGRWLAHRRMELRTYGRVLVAGGCAAAYYATYAAHFVPALRIIESPVLGGGLLLALGTGFAAWADRRKSQTLAGATVALSFYTAAINSLAPFSLFSNLVISATALVLIARHRWTGLSFLSLLGSYGAFLFWRFQQTHSLLPVADAAAFWPAVLFPLGYWLVHTAAAFVRAPRGVDPASRPLLLTLNNGAAYALAGSAIWANHPDTFWLVTVVYGGVLLVLSRLAARRSPEDPAFDGTLLAQGLGLLALGLFIKLSGWQLAVSFASLAATLMALGRHRHGPILRFFAGVAAVIATVTVTQACVTNAPHHRLTAAAVAAILTGAALTLKRQTQDPRTDWRALGLLLLAATTAALACAQGNHLATGLCTAGLALAVALTFRLRPGRELAFAAQPLALLGQLELAAIFLISDNNPAAVPWSLAFGLAFVLLWQTWLRPLAGRPIWQALHLIVPTALALVWLFDHVPADWLGFTLAAVALGTLLVGQRLRAGVLAADSLPFTAAALIVTTHGLTNHSAWPPAAGTLALLLAQSPVLARTALPATATATLRTTLRGVTLALAAGLVFAHAPAESWFLAFALAALGFYLVLRLNRSTETFVHAGLLATLATVLWFARLPHAPAHALDAIGFLALALAGQTLRARSTPTGAATVAPGLAVLATLGGWILLHRLVAASAGGFLLTVSWSLLTLVMITAGFLLRDRVYRLLGLAVLGATLGRIFLIDVWQLDTLFRILSFLVLGLVLLALGFIYNRHADRIRRWL